MTPEEFLQGGNFQVVSPDEFLDGGSFTIEEEQAQPKRLSFLQGVKQDVGERSVRFAEGVEAQKRKEQTGLETGVQLVGQAAGLGYDILGRGASAITPEFVEQPVRRLFGKIGEGIAKIPGVSKIAQEVSERPRLARNIEAGVNIAGVVPAVKGLQTGYRLGRGGIQTTRGALASRTEQKGLQEAVNLTKPVLGKQEVIATFEKAGKPGGITQKGKLGKITKQPTLEEIEVAQTAQPFISKSRGISRNLYNLNQEVERFSTQEARPFLKQNPRIFNLNQLESHLKKV